MNHSLEANVIERLRNYTAYVAVVIVESRHE